MLDTLGVQRQIQLLILSLCAYCTGSRHSADDIVAGSRAEKLGFQISVKKKSFSQKRADWFGDALNLHRGHFSTVKRPGREVIHSPQLALILGMSGPANPLHGVNRDQSTFISILYMCCNKLVSILKPILLEIIIYIYQPTHIIKLQVIHKH
jgi:hypothetical protein